MTTTIANATAKSYNTGAPSVVRQFVHYLHNGATRPHLFSLFTTGAGQSCVKWLLDVNGASQSILEIRVPYARASADECLRNQDPSGLRSQFKYVSLDISQRLARDAYHRSLVLMRDERQAGRTSGKISVMDLAGQCFGLSCTASVRSGSPKRGKHHFWISLYGRDVHREYYLSMDKDIGRTREEEDEIAALVMMRALADYCSDSGTTDEETDHEMQKHRDSLVAFINSVLADDEVIEERVHNLHDRGMIGQRATVESTLLGSPRPTTSPAESVAFDDFYEGGTEYVAVDLLNGHGKHAFASNHVNLVRHVLPSNNPLLIFPGSFNPLHIGHVQLVKQAKQILLERGFTSNDGTDVTVAFELAVVNPDKPSLDRDQVEKRTMQFFDRQWQDHLKEMGSCFLFLTKGSLFVDKAKMFASSNRVTFFVAGIDTVERILNPSYYGNSQSKMVQVLSDFYSRYNVRFLVGGRVDKQRGKFLSMNDLLTAGLVPVGFEDLFIQIPEQDFRLDISSTEIREGLKKPI